MSILVGKCAPFVYIITTFCIIVQARITYKMLMDDEDLVRPCAAPDEKRLAESVDLSGLNFEFRSDDTVHVEGEIRWLWQLDPDDDVKIQINTYRKKGPDYVPTVYNFIRYDGCEAIFDKSETWYTNFFANIYEEDKVCMTHHDNVIWRLHPINFSILLEQLTGIDIVGKYKIVIDVKAVNKTKHLKNEHLCFQVFGEVLKNE